MRVNKSDKGTVEILGEGTTPAGQTWWGQLQLMEEGKIDGTSQPKRSKNANCQTNVTEREGWKSVRAQVQPGHGHWGKNSGGGEKTDGGQGSESLAGRLRRREGSSKKQKKIAWGGSQA